MQFIGSIGGVFDIFLFIFSFFAIPFSEFSFYISAIKKLYLVKVKNLIHSNHFNKTKDNSFLYKQAIDKFEKNITL